MNELFHVLLYSIVYLFLILTIYLVHAFNEKENRKNYLNDLIIILVFVLISSIRCNFGSDYFEYYKIYNFASISDISLRNFHILSGDAYYVLANIIKSISTSEYAIFTAVALILYPGFITFFRKYSKNVSESIFLFLCLDFYTITNNVLKQSIALLFLAYAFECLQKNKRFTFALLSFISISFHLSSIIVIILMIVAKHIQFNKKNILFIVLFSFLFVIFYPSLIKILILMFPFFNEYLIYSGAHSSLIFKFASISYILLTLLFMVKIGRSELNKEDKVKMNMVVLGLPLLFISLDYVVFIRLCYLSLLQLCILVPKYYSIIRLKNRKLVIKPVFAILCAFFIIITITSGNNRYYGYTTIYNDKPTEKWYQ